MQKKKKSVKGKAKAIKSPYLSAMNYLAGCSKGAERVAVERIRQVSEEGFSQERDQMYRGNELVWMAIHFAAPKDPDVVDTVIRQYHDGVRAQLKEVWPHNCDPNFCNAAKQHSRIRQLEIAGALIAAEIDRLLLAEKKKNKAEIDHNHRG